MSGGKQIPDEWVRDEYAIPVFWVGTYEGVPMYTTSLEHLPIPTGQRHVQRLIDLAEIRRAEADTL